MKTKNIYFLIGFLAFHLISCAKQEKTYDTATQKQDNKTMVNPANRVSRIRSLTGATEVRKDVDALLTQISKIQELPPAPAKLRDFAERYTAAWCSQNAASVAAFFAPNGSLTVNYGAPAVGRQAITDVAQGFMTVFPDMMVLMDDLLALGNQAVYCWTLKGTNTGPGGTGQRVRIGGFEVWQIGADGLVAESLGHFDSMAYQHQLEHGVEEAQ